MIGVSTFSFLLKKSNSFFWLLGLTGAAGTASIVFMGVTRSIFGSDAIDGFSISISVLIIGIGGMLHIGSFFSDFGFSGFDFVPFDFFSSGFGSRISLGTLWRLVRFSGSSVLIFAYSTSICFFSGVLFYVTASSFGGFFTSSYSVTASVLFCSSYGFNFAAVADFFFFSFFSDG